MRVNKQWYKWHSFFIQAVTMMSSDIWDVLLISNGRQLMANVKFIHGLTILFSMACKVNYCGIYFLFSTNDLLKGHHLTASIYGRESTIYKQTWKRINGISVVCFNLWLCLYMYVSNNNTNDYFREFRPEKSKQCSKLFTHRAYLRTAP